MRKFKLVTIGTLLAMSVSLSSCGGNKADSTEDGKAEQENVEETPAVKQLKKQIEAMNATLPVNMQGGLKMTKVVLEDGYLVYTCEYPETMEFTVSDDKATTQAILGSIPRVTLKMLSDNNLGIKYIYVQSGSNDEQTLTITPDDIKAI